MIEIQFDKNKSFGKNVKDNIISFFFWFLLSATILINILYAIQNI